eukprot:1158316-Pelagomonas_calceolata.AAC.4
MHAHLAAHIHEQCRRLAGTLAWPKHHGRVDRQQCCTATPGTRVPALCLQVFLWLHGHGTRSASSERDQD